MYKQTNKRINQQLEKEERNDKPGSDLRCTIVEREERKKERKKKERKKERKQKENDKLMNGLHCTIVNK
jgi:hypothetical protein